jgi:hypothetical protein
VRNSLALRIQSAHSVAHYPSVGGDARERAPVLRNGLGFLRCELVQTRLRPPIERMRNAITARIKRTIPTHSRKLTA